MSLVKTGENFKKIDIFGGKLGRTCKSLEDPKKPKKPLEKP